MPSCVYFCIHTLVINNSTGIRLPLHQIRGMHLLLIHPNVPMDLFHPSNLRFQVYNDPNPIYEEIHTTIDIIKLNHTTIRVKHISIPINYVHNKYSLMNIDPIKLKTTVQTADIGTKISTPNFPILDCGE